MVLGEDLELSYLWICKGELIYVDDSHDLQLLWDRISVPCTVRMRSTESCVKRSKTFSKCSHYFF